MVIQGELRGIISSPHSTKDFEGRKSLCKWSGVIHIGPLYNVSSILVLSNFSSILVLSRWKNWKNWIAWPTLRVSPSLVIWVLETSKVKWSIKYKFLGLKFVSLSPNLLTLLYTPKALQIMKKSVNHSYYMGVMSLISWTILLITMVLSGCHMNPRYPHMWG